MPLAAGAAAAAAAGPGLWLVLADVRAAPPAVALAVAAVGGALSGVAGPNAR